MNYTDNAFILVCAALVMFMTPGLALFYGGLVRSKNVLATIMQSFIMLGLMSVLWAVIGYTLSFGTDIGGLIGGLDFVFLKGVGMTNAGSPRREPAPSDIHDLPVHVRGHHPGADHRGICRAHEVRRFHGAFPPCG